MKKAVLFCLLVLTASNLFSQQTDFPKLTGPYLGQKPPGMTPEIFAPGIVSTKEDEYALEINSAGDEILFIRKSKIMLATRNKNGIWNQPVVAPFSGQFIDDEPCFFPDGNKIYFMSRRSAPGLKFGANLWIVEKKENKWMETYPLKSLPNEKKLHAPSIAANGTIYDDGIIRFPHTNGIYKEQQSIALLKGGFPFIAPDESYIIFSARNPNRNDYDLLISFHQKDKTWSKGIPLGIEINSSKNEVNSFMTADGKYLFFSREFDIYWVDAKIIEELKPKE